MTISLGRAVLELATNNAALNAGMGEANKAVSGFQAGVKKASGDLVSIENIAKKAGQAIAGAFAITAVIGAVKSFTDLTGQLTDMSAKTGIGTTALQKLKFMAEQSGGSLDQVTSAITKMGVKLVSGEAGTVKAMERLGLSIDEVRRMEPDQAFAVIADKIATIESPMERARIATELFGKAGADMLPMMTGNLEEMGKKAEDMGLILSEDVVAAGDDFGDTLGQLFTAGMAILGKVLGPFLPLLSLLAQGLVQVATVIGNVLQPVMEVLVAVGMKVFDFLVLWVGKLLDFASKIPGVSTVIKGLKDAFDVLKAGAQTFHSTIVGVDKGTTSAATGMAKLKYELPPTTAGLKEAAKATKELTTEAGALVKRVNEEEQAHHKNQIALQKQFMALQDTIKGHRQLQELSPATTLLTIDWTARIERNRDRLKELAGVAGKEFSESQDKARTAIALAKEELDRQEENARQLGNALIDLGGIMNNKFVSAVGSIVNVFGHAKDAVKDFKSGLSDLTSGGGLTSILSGFTGIVSGIGGIVSAAMAAIEIGKGLFNAFRGGEEGTQVNPARDAFIGQFGPGGTGEGSGFRTLANLLHELTGSGSLFDSLASARTMANFTGAVSNIESLLRERGAGGYATGTPNMDYVDFGKSALASLHGREAVIPEGGAGALASQIASALGRMGGGGDDYTTVVNVDGETLFRIVDRRYGNRLRSRQLVGAV